MSKIRSRCAVLACVLALAGATTLVFLVPGKLMAHCDTMDGPVVRDARAAIEKKDVTGVLKWVRAADEREIRAAFDKAVAVMDKGPEVRELAETYFFETLVRVHRAAEGAPYTGLKPAGAVEPIVAAADKAIETGSVENLEKEVAAMVSAGIRERFTKVVENRKRANHNVEAGRQYVESYVEFVHYVERLHNDAKTSAAHAEGAEPATAEHKH